jgi:hypothetical protein
MTFGINNKKKGLALKFKPKLKSKFPKRLTLPIYLRLTTYLLNLGNLSNNPYLTIDLNTTH